MTWPPRAPSSGAAPLRRGAPALGVARVRVDLRPLLRVLGRARVHVLVGVVLDHDVVELLDDLLEQLRGHLVGVHARVEHELAEAVLAVAGQVVGADALDVDRQEREAAVAVAVAVEQRPQAPEQLLVAVERAEHDQHPLRVADRRVEHLVGEELDVLDRRVLGAEHDAAHADVLEREVELLGQVAGHAADAVEHAVGAGVARLVDGGLRGLAVLRELPDAELLAAGELELDPDAALHHHVAGLLDDRLRARDELVHRAVVASGGSPRSSGTCRSRSAAASPR